jgi:16S rRNA (guanine(527)-N(7))-methyltransferase RsmG
LECYRTTKKKIYQSLKASPLIADVGSGNGVPGLIWAICDKTINIVLIEKNAKKIAFLNHTIGILNLGHRVTTLCDDVSKINSVQFDIITSRAYSDCLKFIESTKSISKENSIWMIMTTVSRSSNITENALKKINMEINKVISVKLNKEKTNKQIIFFKKYK